MLEDIPFSTPSIQVVSIILGLAVLVLGRKLFWLFVGVAGFVVGLNLATELLRGEQADWLVLAAGLAVGLLGAVVAIVVQRIAIGIAGFIIGGFGLIWLLRLVGLMLGQGEWVVFVVGGIVGALLVVGLFDIALILLSSLAGASLVVEALSFDPLLQVALFVLLIAAGIVIQFQLMREF